MAVDNLIMPETVSVGFKGGPTFSTEKVVAVSMQDAALPEPVDRPAYVHLGPAERRQWNGRSRRALIDTLRKFWFDRRGDFKAFLMKDWADF
jgi:hypothetical protein